MDTVKRPRFYLKGNSLVHLFVDPLTERGSVFELKVTGHNECARGKKCGVLFTHSERFDYYLQFRVVYDLNSFRNGLQDIDGSKIAQTDSITPQVFGFLEYPQQRPVRLDLEQQQPLLLKN